MAPFIHGPAGMLPTMLHNLGSRTRNIEFTRPAFVDNKPATRWASLDIGEMS